MQARVLHVDEPRVPAAAAFDERRLRHALGRFATGVVVISTGSGDSLHAMTANAFMSGSLRPPLIVVPVGQQARMHERLMDSALFGVSVLSEAQEPHSRHFAGEPSEAVVSRQSLSAGSQRSDKSPHYVRLRTMQIWESRHA